MITNDILVGVELNPKDKREVFIHAAINCIADHGYAETTVRKISKYAGVTPGLLIHYFEGKEDLIAEAYLYLSSFLLDSYAERTKVINEDPVQFLKVFFAARIESETLNPKLLKIWLTFWSMTLNRSNMKHIHQEIYESSLGEMTDMLEKAYEAQGLEVEQKKLRRAAIGIIAIFDGLWLEWSLDPTKFSSEETLQILTEFAEGATGLKLS